MKKISLTLASLVAVVLFWYILGTGFVLKDGANSFSKLSTYFPTLDTNVESIQSFKYFFSF